MKAIARTFASGKTEKLVYQVISFGGSKTLHQIKILDINNLFQTLADCGLPNGKGDSIEHSAFTFEVIFHAWLYYFITQEEKSQIICICSNIVSHLPCHCPPLPSPHEANGCFVAGYFSPHIPLMGLSKKCFTAALHCLVQNIFQVGDAWMLNLNTLFQVFWGRQTFH